MNKSDLMILASHCIEIISQIVFFYFQPIKSPSSVSTVVTTDFVFYNVSEIKYMTVRHRKQFRLTKHNLLLIIVESKIYESKDYKNYSM